MYLEKTCRNCKHGQQNGVCGAKQARSCATRHAMDKGIRNSEIGIMMKITGDYWESHTIKDTETSAD